MLLVRSLLLLFWLLGAEVAADSEVQQHGPFQIFKRNNPNDLTPSFLETEIEEVQEEIFPAKLNISLTLGSIRGLLFYSFDKNNNQLILSLFENDQIYIKVKLRNDDFTEDLVSLCGCKRNCLFETLNLTLEIPSSTLRIQCNGRPAVEHKVPSAVDIDRNYPAIKVGSKSKKNATRMWMVNHPRIGSSIPERNQMVGCIHAVRYRDRDVALTARGPQLRQGCPDACAKQADICNSGSCVGTLNDRPVCDCTAALLMGKTCTDKLNTNSSKTAVFKHRFSSLKVSWKSGTNRRILLLQLKTFNITLFSVEEELWLQHKFYTNVRLTTHTEVLLHKYDPHRAHTAILRFQEEKISIQMLMDNDRVSLIPLDRSPELGRSFVYLTLYSQPGGAADAAIRYTELDIEWSKIDWTILVTPPQVPGSTVKPTESNATSTLVIALAVFVALLVVIFTIILICLVIWKKRRAGFNIFGWFKSLFRRNSEGSTASPTEDEQRKHLIENTHITEDKELPEIEGSTASPTEEEQRKHLTKNTHITEGEELTELRNRRGRQKQLSKIIGELKAVYTKLDKIWGPKKNQDRSADLQKINKNPLMSELETIMDQIENDTVYGNNRDLYASIRQKMGKIKKQDGADKDLVSNFRQLGTHVLILISTIEEKMNEGEDNETFEAL